MMRVLPDVRPCPAGRTLTAIALWIALILDVAASPNGISIDSEDLRLKVEFDRRVVHDGRGEPWLEWSRLLTDSIRTVTTTFPVTALKVELIAAHRANSAIRFGQVRRSRPPRIRFFVQPRATAAELSDDWRGFHEFAHLLIPFPGKDDIWFTEGLASYYQHLLQARVGVIAPETAWQRLYQGFERGRRDRNGRGQTLRKLSKRMWQERAFRRVYWTGAAYFLRVDTRLRTETRGRHSLDHSLATFQHCCRSAHDHWDAEELIEALGRISVARIWQEEYRRMIDQPAEPVFEQTFERLGITISAEGLRFDPQTEAAALRRAWISPPSPLRKPGL